MGVLPKSERSGSLNILKLATGFITPMLQGPSNFEGSEGDSKHDLRARLNAAGFVYQVYLLPRRQ